MTHRALRYATATTVLAGVLAAALGTGPRSFEAYCPFGGAESLWGLARDGEFSCALGPLNLSMLVALLGLTLVAKKAFCGWACPIGFLGELAGRLGGRVWPRRPSLPPAAQRRLSFLRYAVLAVALAFTYRTGELVLRGYDPFYLIFSGFGHGTAGALSYGVLGLLALGAMIVPLAFCRFLCPLGALLDPFSRIGLVRLHRHPALCTGCGQCARACPHGIPVPTLPVVRHADCTNCLECANACPALGSLELRVGRERTACACPL